MQTLSYIMSPEFKILMRVMCKESPLQNQSLSPHARVLRTPLNLQRGVIVWLLLFCSVSHFICN